MIRSVLLAATSLFVLAACQAPKSTEATKDVAAVEAPVVVTAPAGEYVLEKTHASITWSVKHMGLSNYTARFADFDINLTFDPANVENSVVKASINPLSVKTDYPGDYKAGHAGTGFKSWDEDLAKSDKFFNAGKFAKVDFVSTKVERTGERTAKVTGDLTLLGVTKPVTLDATFNGEAVPHFFAKVPAVGFSAVGTFKRSDFGLTYLVGQGVDDDVTVRIEAEFLQAPQAAPKAG